MGISSDLNIVEYNGFIFGSSAGILLRKILALAFEMITELATIDLFYEKKSQFPVAVICANFKSYKSFSTGIILIN